MSLLSMAGGATGTGTVTLLAPVTNTNRTLTLPDATDTVAGIAATQTLTNKTLTSPSLTTPNINSAQVATVLGAAPLYFARAWVVFTGTGTVTIRGSGNVSSVTDNGTGDYGVNFTTAMTDADYCFVTGVSSGNTNAMGSYSTANILAGSLRLYVYRTDTSVAEDASSVNVAIFR